MKLFEEFNKSSKEEWENKILEDLKGKTLDALSWNSEIGELTPVLFSKDIKHLEPNYFPYTRGTSSIDNSWNIRQQFKNKDSKKLNENILKALKGGVNSLEILEFEENNLDVIFKDVQLDIIQIQIHINSLNAKTICDNLIAYCKQNKYNLNSIKGGVIFDPINELLEKGSLNFEKETIEILRKFKLIMPNMSTFGVNVGIYSNSGANIDTQIACALTHGHEYLEQRLIEGENVLDIANSIEFSFAIGTSYFMEIAKIRAFRSLWSLIINEYDNKLSSFDINITAITSNFNYSLDKYNNLLRATTSAMSAIIAGVNSLTILPFDYNNDKDSEDFGLRLAKNIQLLLKEESYFGQVIDPSGGSYYIEEITDKLRKKSWDIFKEFEDKGGIIPIIASEYLQKLIHSEYKNKEQNIISKKSIMVGVNEYVQKDKDKNNTTKEITTEVSVIEKLKNIRISSCME